MARQSRRSFLKRTAAGAAGVYTSLALAGVDATGSVPGANERIHVGVAGIHGRGGAHIGAFSGMENVEVTYLIDPDSRLFGKRKGRQQCVQDIRKALDDKNLHAVSIATCNHWHSLITVWACQAGKDVYVEKPCSHNVFEGRQCVEAARKYKRIVQHGTQRRSGGGGKQLQDIASGKRGKLLLARGGNYNGRGSIGFKPHREPPKELDFNLWVGPAPIQPYHDNLVHYNWHWFWDFGNGDIGNRAVHRMDQLRWMIPNATLPKSVWSLGGRFVVKDQAETPNLQMAVYDFGETTLIYEVSNIKTRSGGPGTVFDTSSPAKPMEITSPPDVKNPAAPPGPGGEIFKNFIACVRSRKSEELDAHILEGHYSSALCHLPNISYRLGKDVPFSKQSKAFGDDKEVYRSFEWIQDTLKDNGLKLEETTYRLGRKLQLDPEKECFIEDDEANLLLTREYRAPFVVPEEV